MIYSRKYENIWFFQKKSSDYWRQRCVFIDEEYFMRLSSQCNVAVLFKKIIYIIEEGQERMREKKEQKKKKARTKRV